MQSICGVQNPIFKTMPVFNLRVSCFFMWCIEGCCFYSGHLLKKIIQMDAEFLDWIIGRKKEYLQCLATVDSTVSRCFVVAKLDLLTEIIAKIHELNQVEETEN
ncbi:MAG: hypothetical protein WKF70_15080, partial [Chitinophagaceae bacterium]